MNARHSFFFKERKKEIVIGIVHLSVSESKSDKIVVPRHEMYPGFAFSISFLML